MLDAELKNLAMVAAEAARQQGFENTYRALISLVQESDGEPIIKEADSVSEVVAEIRASV